MSIAALDQKVYFGGGLWDIGDGNHQVVRNNVDIYDEGILNLEVFVS
jgi:hypothetical protein